MELATTTSTVQLYFGFEGLTSFCQNNYGSGLIIQLLCQLITIMQSCNYVLIFKIECLAVPDKLMCI